MAGPGFDLAEDLFANNLSPGRASASSLIHAVSAACQSNVHSRYCLSVTRPSPRLIARRDGLKLGTHRMHCHAEEIAFLVTAMSQEHGEYEEHLLRLLQLTDLHGIQWINLNHANIEFVTLRRRPRRAVEKRNVGSAGLD
jgi:hypothetical protein